MKQSGSFARTLMPKRFDNGLRISVNDCEQRCGALIGYASSGFPVLDRIETKSINPGERRLGDTELRRDALDVERVKWSKKTVKVKDLKPYERNPRRITEDAYGRLKKSLSENGYNQRIIATKDLRIIGGHQRIRALRELGLKEIAVLVPDKALSDDQFRRLLVEDISKSSVATLWPKFAPKTEKLVLTEPTLLPSVPPLRGVFRGPALRTSSSSACRYVRASPSDQTATPASPAAAKTNVCDGTHAIRATASRASFRSF
jgi:hypothetical protein